MKPKQILIFTIVLLTCAFIAVITILKKEGDSEIQSSDLSDKRYDKSRIDRHADYESKKVESYKNNVATFQNKITIDELTWRLDLTLTSLNPDLAFDQEVESIMDEIGATAAIELFRMLPTGIRKQVALGKALFRLSRTDRASALSIAIILDPMDLHDLTISNLFIPNGSNDVLKSLQDALSLRKGEIREKAINVIIRSGEFVDPDQIISLMNTSGLSLSEKKILDSYYVSSLAADDPRNAAEQIEALNIRVEPYLLNKIIDKWPIEDLTSAAEWLNRNSDSPSVVEMGVTSIINRLFRENPEDAIGLLYSLPPGEVADRAAELMTNLMYDQSPEIAYQWIEGLRNGITKNRVTEEYVMRISATEPKNAMRELGRLQTNQAVRAGVEKRILAEWTASNPHEALSWVSENYANPKAASDLRDEIFLAWARSDPDEMSGQVESGKIVLNESAADALIDSLAVNRGVSSAAKFLTQNGWETPANVSVLASRWMSDNSIEASKWISSLPPGELFDAGARVVAIRAAPDDFQGAIEWAHRISDPRIKADVLSKIHENE